METMEQKHECDTDAEHNGCVGHPITNMLMGAEPVALANDGAQPGDADHAYTAQAPGLDELPPQVLAEVEAAFDELHGKAALALGQVAATDERTAHLVIDVERLSRGLDDAHGKLDRILNHFKVA
ncbi:hypothetical protein [Massilia timonae]|uniref:hypothetical protein n=1 Tax=Massilia timonae TaxID=47229 RepID=UPI0028D25A6F|nr:hypothetical protein [Massilia timonae]